jgi:hypothetical protein
MAGIKRTKLDKKIMADARSEGNPCIRCGSTGTTCGRHYLLVADLCSECDGDFQEGSVPKNDFLRRIEYSEDFQHWCLMTLIRREEREIIS